MSSDGFKAWPTTIRQWLVKTAQSEARYAWKVFKEHSRAAGQQARDAWIDDLATRAKRQG